MDRCRAQRNHKSRDCTCVPNFYLLEPKMEIFKLTCPRKDNLYITSMLRAKAKKGDRIAGPRSKLLRISKKRTGKFHPISTVNKKRLRGPDSKVNVPGATLSKDATGRLLLPPIEHAQQTSPLQAYKLLPPIVDSAKRATLLNISKSG